MPGREELPSTLRRSPAKARETWVKAHDSAVEEYGEGQRAHRTAYGALKRRFGKVGDHWEPKPGGAKGPSDEQSAQPLGQPGRVLVNAARTLSAQLLVVGSRGEHVMSWLLGGQHVLRNAPCPVLVVPDTG